MAINLRSCCKVVVVRLMKLITPPYSKKAALAWKGKRNTIQTATYPSLQHSFATLNTARNHFRHSTKQSRCSLPSPIFPGFWGDLQSPAQKLWLNSSPSPGITRHSCRFLPFHISALHRHTADSLHGTLLSFRKALLGQRRDVRRRRCRHVKKGAATVGGWTLPRWQKDILWFWSRL